MVKETPKIVAQKKKKSKKLVVEISNADYETMDVKRKLEIKQCK